MMRREVSSMWEQGFIRPPNQPLLLFLQRKIGKRKCWRKSERARQRWKPQTLNVIHPKPYHDV